MSPKRFDTFDSFQQAYHFDFNDPNNFLGNGNYGQVIKGWEYDQNRYVAIKQSLRPDDDSVKREFDTASELNHRNITRYLAYGRLTIPHVGPRDFTVMQYYPDGNLSQFIRDKRNTLSEAQLKSLVRGILEGLAYLHDQKRLHRDFKPSNILVTFNSVAQQYVPIIADFGSIKLVDKANTNEFSLSEHAKTLAYAAPEQIQGDTRVGYNLDLWAFGVVLYEIMTAGSHPFTHGLTNIGDSTARTILSKRIMSVELPKVFDQIAEPYQEMIRRCLVADQTLRVQRETELLDLLDEVPQKLASASQYFNTGNIDLAKTHYQTVLKLRPENEEAEQGILACEVTFKRTPTLTDEPVTDLMPGKLQKIYPLRIMLRVGFLSLLPLALGYVIAHNFKVFGKPVEAKKTWLYAVLATGIEYAVSFVLPGSVSFQFLSSIFLFIATVLIGCYIAKQSQRVDIETHIHAGGLSYSGWKVIGMSWPIGILFSFLCVFIFGLPGSPQTEPDKPTGTNDSVAIMKVDSGSTDSISPSVNADSLFTTTKTAFLEQGLDKNRAAEQFRRAVSAKPHLGKDVFLLFMDKAQKLKSVSPELSAEYERIAGTFISNIPQSKP